MLKEETVEIQPLIRLLIQSACRRAKRHTEKESDHKKYPASEEGMETLSSHPKRRKATSSNPVSRKYFSRISEVHQFFTRHCRKCHCSAARNFGLSYKFTTTFCSPASHATTGKNFLIGRDMLRKICHTYCLPSTLVDKNKQTPPVDRSSHEIYPGTCPNQGKGISKCLNHTPNQM